MNQSIFLFINNVAGRWFFLDQLMVFFAVYLVFVIIVTVLIFEIKGYLHPVWAARWRNMAVVALGSALVARFGVVSLIRLFYYHARPYLVIVETHLLVARDSASSFPSGHTTFVFALATAVYAYNKKMGAWFYLMACLVGFARIFVGIHWPYDIGVGAILGILTGLACNWIFKKYKHVVGL